jgi:hypothetical protein
LELTFAVCDDFTSFSGLPNGFLFTFGVFYLVVRDNFFDVDSLSFGAVFFYDAIDLFLTLLF